MIAKSLFLDSQICNFNFMVRMSDYKYKQFVDYAIITNLNDLEDINIKRVILQPKMLEPYKKWDVNLKHEIVCHQKMLIEEFHKKCCDEE